MFHAAIELLPHLVEAMNRACGVIEISERVAVCELERARRKRIHVGDARVWSFRSLSRAAGDQRRIDTRGQTIFGLLREGKAIASDVGIFGAADERSGESVMLEQLLFGAELERVGCGIFRGELFGFEEVRAGSAIRLHDAFGEQIPDAFAALGNVGGENVIEAAIFSDDYDYVLDRRTSFCVSGCLAGKCSGQRSSDGVLQKRQRNHSCAEIVPCG